MTRQNNVHYVNNKKFHESLIVYKKKLDESKENYFKKYGEYPLKNENWEGRPRIPNYIGDCFLKIATHLSYRPNFVNYMYRDDMISDAAENCAEYINNFDVNRSNPFAYFTQICYYAFLRRISREKRQVEIKEKLLERSYFDEVFTADEHYDSSEYNSIKDAIQSKYY